MKLTAKDAEFLAKLRRLLDEKNLRIELKENGLKRMVLRKNYGDKIEGAFRLSRQGVRWRFQRVADMYVSAYETILYVESRFGTELRQWAMTIARERAELQRESRQALGVLRR